MSGVPTADEATGEMVGGARQFGLSITIPFRLAIEPLARVVRIFESGYVVQGSAN
jgi:hypothetical protein